jgi:hypothetical protein
VLLSEGSGDVSGCCGTSAEESMAIENRRASQSCSSVAKLATEALAALDAGQIDLARERMARLVSAMVP